MTSLGTNLLLVFVWLVAFQRTSGELSIKPSNDTLFIKERNATGTPIINLIVSPATQGQVLKVALKDPKNCLNLGTSGNLSIKCTTECNIPIVTKKGLDRESECGRFRLVVNFGFQKVPEKTKVYTIILTDVNDNAPQFVNLPYKLSLLENTKPGPLKELEIKAIDRDNGYNGAVFYTLKLAGRNSANANEIMTINKSNGTITLNKELDYETRNFYQYNVIAEDQGNPSLSSTASVWIQVLDFQDTPPVFIKPSFITHIKENATIGTTVLRVSAEDGDRGVPNEIRYKLQGDVCGRFKIDDKTGIITLQISLHLTIDKLKNTNGVCTVTVKAVELNNEASFTEQNATIFIDDVNDNSPLFTMVSYSGSISEGAFKGNPVILKNTIQVTDIDQQVENSKFTLSLQHMDDSPFTALKVEPQESVSRAVLSLVVNDTSQIDYEKSQFLEFKIVAEGYQKLHKSSATVNLTILPFNEYKPIFNKNYTACVPEDAKKGAHVIEVKATDKDSGTDGSITYSLYGSNSLFLMDPHTGKVTVGSDKLDYERVQSYNLTVEATDGGNKKGTAQLYICINDTNDETPTFTSSVYEETMTENKKYTIKIEAKDKDKSGTPNSNVSYTIGNVNQGLHGNFTINEISGEIQVESIDNEQLKTNPIVLEVKATDHGKPPLSSTAKVIIKVLGTNDNSPYFLGQNYNFSIPENAITGEVIGNVSARDDDREEINKKLTYILINETDKFRINSWNGNIFVLGKLDRETKSSYSLEVAVIDGGTPPCSATTTVDITVTDINDEFPTLSHVDDITVYENHTLQSIITKINATDNDLDAKLVYNISSQKIKIDGEGMFVNKYSEEYFRININTGEVYVNKLLDREIAEVISLEIQVTDLNAVGGSQVTKGQININILDINDNPPVFLKEKITLQKYENIPLKTLITTVSATDIDKEDKVTYSFKEDYEQFTINETSGEITLCEKLDRETNEHITLFVLAKDTKPTRHTATATLLLTLLDYNDNSPTFIDGAYNRTYDIREDSKEPKEIVTVNATDADTGINAEIRYDLVYRGSVQQLPICINHTQGTVFVCGQLDREKTPFYIIEIQAKDMRGEHNVEARTGTTSIKINVTDVNDKAPVFSLPNYSATVREDVSADNTILQVQATDEDIGDNKRISFSLEGNVSAMFKIEPSSGIIKVNESLIDKVGPQRFLVVATDHGSPSLNTSAKVVINITDMNNHPPKFSEQKKVINITEVGGIYIPWSDDRYAATFTSEEYHQYVQSCVAEVKLGLDTCPNQFIHTVLATDADVYLENKRVTYILKKGKDSDHFHLDETSGKLTLIKMLDRESQPVYLVEIIARDNGKPRLESETFQLEINAINVDDEPPVFLENVYPDFKKSFRIAEGKPKLYIGQIRAYDSDPISKPCFKIIGQNEKSFEVNSSGTIFASEELDYEEKNVFNFKVKTYDCNNGVYNVCGNSVNTDINNKLSITINVTDTNDNPPKFIHKSMSFPIQSDTKMGEAIQNLTARITDDDDYPENKKNYFKIFNFKEYGDLSAKAKPFFVEKGFLKTNQSFLAAQMGYIQFSIQVCDSSGQNDTAEIKVYVVGKANKIKIELFMPVEKTQERKDQFTRDLADILKHNIKILVGKIEPHRISNGKYEKRITDMYIFGVQNETIMTAKELQDLIDLKANQQTKFLKQYAVITVTRPHKEAVSTSTASKNKVILLAVIALLTISLFAILLLFYASNQRYKRKLKAAKIDVHSNKQDFEKWVVPGSNVHALGQSNPIYNKEINPNIALPEKTSLNSLDLNEVGDSAVFMDPFDEQEIALDFIEDPNETNNTFQDSSKTFLDNVIKEREEEMNKKNQNSGSMSGHTNMALSVTSLETTDV